MYLIDMRAAITLSILAALVICERSTRPPAPPSSAAVDFSKDIRPVLEKRCTPCHFEGGIMHARLPFDKPETIVKLGTKLFTRIRDEESRALIRKFLAQQSRSKS